MPIYFVNPGKRRKRKGRKNPTKTQTQRASAAIKQLGSLGKLRKTNRKQLQQYIHTARRTSPKVKSLGGRRNPPKAAPSVAEIQRKLAKLRAKNSVRRTSIDAIKYAQSNPSRKGKKRMARKRKKLKGKAKRAFLRRMARGRKKAGIGRKVKRRRARRNPRKKGYKRTPAHLMRRAKAHIKSRIKQRKAGMKPNPRRKRRRRMRRNPVLGVQKKAAKHWAKRKAKDSGLRGGAYKSAWRSEYANWLSLARKKAKKEKSNRRRGAKRRWKKAKSRKRKYKKTGVKTMARKKKRRKARKGGHRKYKRKSARKGKRRSRRVGRPRKRRRSRGKRRMTRRQRVRGMRSVRRARRTIRWERKHGRGLAKAYMKRHRMRSNPGGALVDTLKGAIPVVVTFVGINMVNKLSIPFVDMLGIHKAPLLSIGAVVGLNFLAKKVNFIAKHKTNILLGAGIATIQAIWNAYVPASVKSMVGLGDYVSVAGLYDGTGDYVSTSDYVSTGSDYSDMGAMQEMGSLGSWSPRLLEGAIPTQGSAALIHARANTMQIPAWAPSADEEFYQGVFGNRMLRDSD